MDDEKHSLGDWVFIAIEILAICLTPAKLEGGEGQHSPVPLSTSH